VVFYTCTGAEAGAFRRVPVAAHIGAICVSVLAIVAVATYAAAAAASTNKTLRHAHEPFLQARITGCESLQQQSNCMSAVKSSLRLQPDPAVSGVPSPCCRPQCRTEFMAEGCVGFLQSMFFGCACSDDTAQNNQ
jgi:hypothetical protein